MIRPQDSNARFISKMEESLYNISAQMKDLIDSFVSGNKGLVFQYRNKNWHLASYLCTTCDSVFLSIVKLQ